MASGGGSADVGGGAPCSRELLGSTVDAYLAALAAHDPGQVRIAASVKSTENGGQVPVGEGLWLTAGVARFKRSALDTAACSTLTEAVVPEDGVDRIFGVRLRLVEREITEIETIVVRDGDYLVTRPSGLVATASDDWESELPADQRTPREGLRALVDTYFDDFPGGGCDFTSDCQRLENGAPLGACVDGVFLTCDPGVREGGAAMGVRAHVLDEEAGIAAGLTMFGGVYTDAHLFKVRAGKVGGVHAVLARAPSSGWD
jgi:hypothetical protein